MDKLHVPVRLPVRQIEQRSIRRLLSHLRPSSVVIPPSTFAQRQLGDWKWH